MELKGRGELYLNLSNKVLATGEASEVNCTYRLLFWSD